MNSAETLKEIYARLGAVLRAVEADRAALTEARAKIARVRDALAPIPACDCGDCLACRVADVLGAP